MASSPGQNRPAYIGEGSAAVGRAFELLKEPGQEDGAVELILRGCRRVCVFPPCRGVYIKRNEQKQNNDDCAHKHSFATTTHSFVHVKPLVYVPSIIAIVARSAFMFSTVVLLPTPSSLISFIGRRHAHEFSRTIK